MLEFERVVAQLTLATGQAEGIRHDLSQRQYDMLALEEVVCHLSGGSPMGRIVIDQAEDIRRAINGRAAEQLQDIHTAIDCARVVVAGGAVDGELSPDRARMLAHLIGNAVQEARRATVELGQVGVALADIAQANPAELGLARTARIGIDEASNRLEHARRSVFRVAEALPPLICEMWKGPVSGHGVLETELASKPKLHDRADLIRGCR